MKQKIYLIPGTMCNEQLWSALLPLLMKTVGDSFEFIHVKIPKDMCFSELSVFLNDFFKEKKVTLIGFSLGGYITAHFAAHFPERVEKSFIIANSPCALYPAEEKQRQEIVEFVNQYGYKGMSKTRAAQLFDSSIWSKNQLEQLISIMISMDAELGEADFKSQMRCTSKREDLFELLTNSQIPLCFYYSEHDSLVNTVWLDKLQQANSNCMMICSSGSSHMLPLEKPSELAEYVHRWFS